MAVFGRIALGCTFGFALLTQAGLVFAASNPPRVVIPQRGTNSVICDFRGCFGFGPQQFYTRPGQPLPNAPPYTNGRSVYDSPRIQIPPREAPTPPPRALYPSPAQKLRQHQTWCAERYRTYNPGTNSYTTINQGTRTCRSPFG